MINAIRAAFNRLISEPAFTLALVVAAVNATTVQTWQGYGAAVGTALLRFVVSPVYGRDDTPVEWS